MQQQVVRPVTMQDIAAKTGFSLTTVSQCMRAKSSLQYKQSTVDTIRKAATDMGYDARKARSYKNYANLPANPLFESKKAETAAMVKLRAKGLSNPEIAHRCGVRASTVRKRIGTQPAEITAAHLKLAGAVRTAKHRIQQSYQAQQQIAQYNALAAQLNQQLEAAKATAEQLKAITPASKKAAKITGTKLLVVSNILQ